LWSVWVNILRPQQLMRILLSSLLVCSTAATLVAQSRTPGAAPDTLIQEHFFKDPAEEMLPAPTGHDFFWVNFDEDKRPHADSLPGAWFWDRDLVDTLNNDCYTSASFLKSFTRNRNWLILPKIHIPDDSYWFCWRSQPFEGPGFMDGYRVLVSTTSNLPSDKGFKDTLFAAAETVSLPQQPTLNLNAFTFSKGYIHAQGFTDSNYFFIDKVALPNGATFEYYRCIFEPHAVSLKAYAGKEIFIAILHDAFRDNILQIDDILITNAKTTATQTPDADIQELQVLGHSAQTDALYIRWTLRTAQAHRLLVTDAQGRVWADQHFDRARGENLWHLDHLPAAGVYFVVLCTEKGEKVVKKCVRL
jgi:hypothetical protein